ncbi:MAG: hypothetical protein HZC12_09935 [Nitrospirae bacterium]|nr:hypothetical protein [Nitrospirota bacterium]
MTVFEIIRRALMAGLGMQEKVKGFVDDLVKKGELSETQGAKLVKEWSERAGKTTEEFTKSLSDIIGKTLEKMNLPAKDDIEKLNRKLQSFSVRLKKLEEAKGGEEGTEEK